MIVYEVSRVDYEDYTIVDICSSREKAEEAKLHHYNEYAKGGSSYFSLGDYSITKHELDGYFNKHLSPLSKALA